MAIEWARLKPQRTVELADRGIFLRADGGCSINPDRLDPNAPLDSLDLERHVASALATAPRA